MSPTYVKGPGQGPLTKVGDMRGAPRRDRLTDLALRAVLACPAAYLMPRSCSTGSMAK
jgi:hypothetical protein